MNTPLAARVQAEAADAVRLPRWFWPAGAAVVLGSIGASAVWRWGFALSVAALAGCGGGELYGECPAPASTTLPAAGTVLTPADQRPVVYGTGAPWFTGPLQAAPAAVSAEAGQPLWVCP